jgi:aminoglycoside 3-N-acetyltransferase
MLHASVSAIGWVVGGPDMVIQALLDVLGPEGTLMMYVGWEDDPYKLTEWPEEWQKAYLEECPPFDPQRSRAHRKLSILTEYLRTWPGAFRSDHPEASVTAVGAKAQWLTADHPLNYPFFGRVFHDDCQKKPGEREGPFGQGRRSRVLPL